ncbi:MAG: hypothetical protein EA396_05365 [Anaerolineaceae bacterium]|nr:MAG: hypothetical protein EA396_05365 [Anaerolineaceae bacterium]
MSSPDPDSRRQHITEHGQKILAILQTQRNRWLTRGQIAAALGKRRLTPYDITLLELFVDEGFIQSRQQKGYSREGFRWLYGIFDDPPPDENP